MVALVRPWEAGGSASALQVWMKWPGSLWGLQDGGPSGTRGSECGQMCHAQRSGRSCCLPGSFSSTQTHVENFCLVDAASCIWGQLPETLYAGSCSGTGSWVYHVPALSSLYGWYLSSPTMFSRCWDPSKGARGDVFLLWTRVRDQVESCHLH